MAKDNKMNWLIEKFNNNQMEYIINATGEKKGTIVAPTGAGKSGMMFSDNIKHILDSKDGEKWIFHYATPILKLGIQAVNDFVAVITDIFKDKCDRGEFMFFINSSADGKNYNLDGLNADVNYYRDIDRFRTNSQAKYAIIISCFDSIYKIANDVEKLNSYTRIVTYIDEAHLIVNETRDDLSYDQLTNDGKERWNSLEKLCKCEYLYALTATPDKYVTEVINKSANLPYDKYIINIYPNELIENNTIVPVHTYLDKVTSEEGVDKVTPQHCIGFMDFVREENPNIFHKILVTCANTEHLRRLREALSVSFKVFSTCSKDGGNASDGDEFMGIDEAKFINEIDSYEGDCFVLHIKQLRQGIDIKSLTDCIFYNSTRVNDGVKRTLIQTIGRCLRPYNGERGIPQCDRKKKCGNVYLLTGDRDYDAVGRQMEDFLIKYYGLKGLKAFTHDTQKEGGQKGMKKGMFHFGKIGDDYFNYFDILIDELKIRMDEYIKKTIKPQYDVFIRLSGGKPNSKLIPMALADMKRRFALCTGEHNTAEIMGDTEFMKAVTELFGKYGIIKTETSNA